MKSYVAFALAVTVAGVNGYVELLWNDVLSQCLSGSVRAVTYKSSDLNECNQVALANGTVIGEVQSGNATTFVLTNYADKDCKGTGKEYPIVIDTGCSAYDGPLNSVIDPQPEEIYIWAVNSSNTIDCCKTDGNSRTVSFIVSPNSDCSEASSNYASTTVTFVEDTCTTKQSILDSVKQTTTATSMINDFVGDSLAIKAVYYKGSLLSKLYADENCETGFLTAMWSSYTVNQCYASGDQTSNNQTLYIMFGCDGGSGCTENDPTTSSTEESSTSVAEQASTSAEEQTATDSAAAGAQKGLGAVMAALVFVAAIVNVL